MSHGPIFVIGIDYGCEGKTAPLTYVYSRQEAEDLKALTEKFHGTAVYIAEVPYWPKLREDT